LSSNITNAAEGKTVEEVVSESDSKDLQSVGGNESTEVGTDILNTLESASEMGANTIKDNQESTSKISKSSEEDLQEPSTSKDDDNNNDDTSFEFVDRSKVVVAAAKERTKSVTRRNVEAVSMKSLKVNPKSISRGPSLMKSRKRKSLRYQNQTQAQPSNDATRPRLYVMAGSINKVMAILYVGGTLWVGRGGGDLLVINVDPDANDYLYGEIIAQMKCDCYLQYFQEGEVDRLIKAGNNKVRTVFICLNDDDAFKLFCFV